MSNPDYCMQIGGGSPMAYCSLCDAAARLDAQVQEADKFGIHYTKRGGYAGKCTMLADVPENPECF